MTGSPRIKHLWLKRAALVLLAPVAFFGLLEVALRTVDYGDPVSFFHAVEVGGKKFAVENPYFGQRFFRRHLPRVPAWNLIPPPSSDVPRIAVIGESAAQGYPLQKIGLASMLGGILEIQHPGRRFDFINACMTSVNSHVLADIVPEVIAQKPDVAVFYTGNNEVVGPYAPGTPFTAWTRHPLAVWLDKNLRRTKTFQLLERSFVALIPKQPTRAWDGFQMFSELTVAADSPALEGVYAAFERNVESMVRSFLRHKVRVVLCTVAVNLADWGPAGSESLPEDSPADRLIEEGQLLLAQGQPAAAVAVLEQATAAAPRHAAAWFLLGRAQQKQGATADARASFERARDLDLYRFRADTRINNIIRQVAARYAERGVVLVDVDRELMPEEIPGLGQFTEHVHMTFEGMQGVALLVAQALAPLLPQLGEPRVFAGADEEELRERLFFTPFDELLLAVVARDVGEIPIFAGRPGAGETREHWSALEEELRRGNPYEAAQLEAAFARAEALRPGDARNAASRADYLSRLGLAAEAAEAGQRVLESKPTYFEGYRFLADAAKAQGNSADAGHLYRRALGIYRLIPDARKNLGDLARLSGDDRAAEGHYSAAFRMDAGHVDAALALAEIEANTSRRELARQTLQLAARHNPRDASVQIALARLESAEGNFAEARGRWEQALDLDADLSPRDLLRLLSEKFPPAEAFTAFSRYRERFGDAHDLYNNYAWLLATSPEASWRNPDTALRLARRAIELSPEPNAYYHGTLAAASAAAGDFDAARSNVQTALGLSSENPGLREELFAMQQLFDAGQPYVEHPMPATP